jgi:hypothetical protein
MSYTCHRIRGSFPAQSVGVGTEIPKVLVELVSVVAVKGSSLVC